MNSESKSGNKNTLPTGIAPNLKATTSGNESPCPEALDRDISSAMAGSSENSDEKAENIYELSTAAPTLSVPGQAAGKVSLPVSNAGKSPPAALVILGGLLLLGLGLSFNLAWLSLIGALLSLVLSWGVMWPSIQTVLAELSPQQRSLLVALPAFFVGLFGLMQATGLNRVIQAWGQAVRWDVVGALGDFLGAFGQILVALLALYVAWRQYVISRDLTVQQNRITQQQTIDAYFQGISELVLDDEGLLEDWPQERIIVEARTAAILSSVDAPGKAKVIRFLSRSKLLTPLQRDRHLGRPILDGNGGYAEDRREGVRVVNLGTMLANANLSGSDLRWTDLSDINLIRANLANCDLVRANFSRTILYQAHFSGVDLKGTRFFYGTDAAASPRSRVAPPNFITGEYTGAVVEGVDFSGAKRMSEEQRRYFCRWGGDSTRATIPGGCDDIPNCLER